MADPLNSFKIPNTVQVGTPPDHLLQTLQYTDQNKWAEVHDKALATLVDEKVEYWSATIPHKAI